MCARQDPREEREGKGRSAQSFVLRARRVAKRQPLPHCKGTRASEPFSNEPIRAIVDANAHADLLLRNCREGQRRDVRTIALLEGHTSRLSGGLAEGTRDLYPEERRNDVRWAVNKSRMG